MSVASCGDEFLCAIPGMSEETVRQRFSEIGSALAALPDARGIRTGFATLQDGETATQLICRADAELIRPPRQRPSNRADVKDSERVDESWRD